MNDQLGVYNIKLPEPVLAYRALKSANLTNDNEKLVKATVTELTLKAMSAQLKKVMGTGTVNEVSGIQIKKEVAFAENSQTKQENEEVLYSGWSRCRSRVREFRGRTRSEEEEEEDQANLLIVQQEEEDRQEHRKPIDNSIQQGRMVIFQHATTVNQDTTGLMNAI